MSRDRLGATGNGNLAIVTESVLSFFCLSDCVCQKVLSCHVCQTVFVRSSLSGCVSDCVCPIVFVRLCLSYCVCQTEFVRQCLSDSVSQVVFVRFCLSDSVCQTVFVRQCLSGCVCQVVLEFLRFCMLEFVRFI